MHIDEKEHKELIRRIEFYREHKSGSMLDAFYHSHLYKIEEALDYIKEGIPAELRTVVIDYINLQLMNVKSDFNLERLFEITRLIKWANLEDVFNIAINKITRANNPNFNPKEKDMYRIHYKFEVRGMQLEEDDILPVCKVTKDEEGRFEWCKENDLVFKWSRTGDPLFLVTDKEYICNLDTSKPYIIPIFSL